MQHTGSVILHTPRLILRPYRLEDTQTMYDMWASDHEVVKYLTWNIHSSPATTEKLMAMWVEAYVSPTVYHWGITLDGLLIGDISVTRWQENEESCEVGYCLSRRFWGQGIMTETLTAVMAHLFDTVGFHRIALYHDVKNPASGRVMQKCGLRFEGIRRGALRRKDGSWADLCDYALLREDR